MISRITAPVGDVTIPMTSGRNGIGFLRSGSNRPSAASFFLRSSRSFKSAPSPATSIVSITIWYFDRPGNVVSRPVTMTSMPSSGTRPSFPACPRQHTPSSTALSSFSARYICPLAARLNPEISPRTRTKEKASSTVRFNAFERSETENSGAFPVFTGVSGTGA